MRMLVIAQAGEEFEAWVNTHESASNATGRRGRHRAPGVPGQRVRGLSYRGCPQASLALI